MALFAPLNSIRFLAQKSTPLPTSLTHSSRISLLPRRISTRSRTSVVLSRAGNGSARDRSGKEEGEDEHEPEEQEEMASVEEKMGFDAYSLLEKRRKEEEEAMRKCREILFRDFCHYLGLTGDEAKAVWAGTEATTENEEGVEERKLEWVREFLAQWSSRYHPLSPRFAKEMLEEHITVAGPPPAPLLVTGE